MAGQTWGTATAGGNLSIGMLSKKLRQLAQPLMRGDQFCRPEPGAGKHKGDTIYINKVSDLTDTGATATPLTEGTPIPIDAATVNRNTLVIDEYGRGIGFTGKLEDLSEFAIDNVFMPPLKNHAAKVINTLALDQFKATFLKYTPTGTAAVPTGTFDTDGTISTAALRDIQAFDVYEIVEYLQGTTFTPTWDGENYAALAHPAFLRKLREDADWEWAAAYAQPQSLLSGEIGRFNGVRFTKNTHGLTSVLGTTAFKGSAVIFGEDAVAVARAVPMEIREKVPADFGRDKAIAWYALLGYKIVWQDTAAAGQVRVIQVTST